MSSDSLSKRMSQAARRLQDHHNDPQATFQEAVDVAHANIEGCDGVGLSFVRARKVVETVANTSQMAFDADQLQYECGEGPCLDSIWEHRTVLSPSLATDGRWPTWGPRVVQETEAQSVLAFQLFTHGDTLGALNLYSRTQDAFNEAARDEGLAIATHVAIAVSAAQQIHNLTIGMDTRTVIGQATGILMERFDLDAGRSFSVLTRMSSQQNVKLRELAQQIVDHRRNHELPVR